MNTLRNKQVNCQQTVPIRDLQKYCCMFRLLSVAIHSKQRYSDIPRRLFPSVLSAVWLCTGHTASVHMSVCTVERTWNVLMSGVYTGAHMECSYVGCVIWSTRGMFLCLVCMLEHTWNVHMFGVYSGEHVECSYVWCEHWSTRGMFLCLVCTLEHTWNVHMLGVYSGAHVEFSYVWCVFRSTRGMLICRCVLWSTRGIFIFRGCIMQHTWNVQMWGVYSGAHMECSYIGLHSIHHALYLPLHNLQLHKTIQLWF
jgi:hypothetical protein